MPPADDTVLVVKATEDTLPAQVTINDDGDEDVKKTERKKKRCRQRESSVAVTAEERRPLKSPGILPRIKQKLKMFEYWRHWSLAVLLMLFIGLAISFHFSHASSSVAPVNNANIQAEVRIPSKHDTLKQCWFNVGPASQTVSQHSDVRF